MREMFAPFSLLLLLAFFTSFSFGFTLPTATTSSQILLPDRRRYHQVSSSRRSRSTSTLHSFDADEDTGSKQSELQISDDETLQIVSSDGSKIPLLRGLSASTWSAGTSTSAGLFLHSNNPSCESSAFDTSLGKLESCTRLMACARLTRYWMGPAFGTSAKDIPLDTQFLFLEVEEGVYQVHDFTTSFGWGLSSQFGWQQS